MTDAAPAPSAEIFRAALAGEAPAYLLDERALRENGEVLRTLASESGAKIVLAQKAFAQPQLYPLLGEYLAGACASGVWEARLAKEYFPAGAEVITCAPAYRDQEIEELLQLSDHLDFNSLSQWERFREQCLTYQRAHGGTKFGLRINPEHSTGTVPRYDPCAVGSRLGVSLAQIKDAQQLQGISGLHFHTLCEQGFEDLEATVAVVEERFGTFLKSEEITYLNLGGGHWITKPNYDRVGLVRLIQRLSREYQVEVYLEPGEAVAIHSGVLVATVLDLVENGEVCNAILDVSATAHMPDVLEMPYRPEVYRADTQELAGTQGEYCYRLAGNSCLAGDQIGDYSFAEPLQVGDRLLFNDMAHYTMVKTTFFNGVRHPEIALLTTDGERQVLRQFSYDDYLALKQI